MAMLKSIKRKINKTPIENSSTIVKSIEKLDENLLLEILTAQHIGEGVFGIEQFSSDCENELYYFTPALQRLKIGEESNQIWNWSNYKFHKHYSYYVIELSQPAFLPIYINTDVNILNDLRLLSNNNVDIFIQILFAKRVDDWRNKVVDQYESFLLGNDYPSPKRASRLLQKGVIKLFEKLEGETFKRDPIEDIESKILDEGYRAEMRVILMSDNEKKMRATENELRVLIRDYDYFNELDLNEVLKHGKKEYLQNIERRSFSHDSLNQILSFNELQSILLSDTAIQTIKTQPLMQPEVTEVKSTPNINNIPLHLLPVGEKKERNIDNELVAELPIALKKARAIKTNHIEVLDVELGATVQRITCIIPDDLVYSDIKSRYQDIQAALGSDISIIQGKEKNTVTFLIPCNEREIVYLKELLEDEKFIEFAKEHPLPFVCGIDMYNQPVYKCLTEAPHLLIAGATNSGKSAFVNSLLITWILLKSPQELRFILIDPKMVELEQYEGLAHVDKVITDMNQAVSTFEKLVEEMEKRYEKFHKLGGVKKITQYNKKSKEKMPYIVCVVDEYNDLKMQDPNVETYIERLGQKARASGIHVILATQRPDKDVVSGVIKTNFPSRISFSLSSNNEYKTVFGTGIPYKNLLGFGDGVVSYVGQTEPFIRFQAPLFTIDDEQVEEKLYEDLKKFYKGEIVSNIKLKEDKETVIEEEPINKLKRIIANTGETRISKLREQMSMRINAVQELMYQLIEEGWLEAPESKSKGYQLIVSEEELNKWKDN